MKRLSRLLIGSPDRVIATISLVVGIVSLGLSIYAYKSPLAKPLYIIFRDVSIVATLVFIIMTLSVKYVIKEELVEKFRNLLAEQLKSHHQMTHKFRDYFFLIIRNELAAGNPLTPSQINEIKKEYFEKVSRTVLTDTRELFMEYFRSRNFKVGDDVTLTIKLVIEAEEAQHILDRLKGGKADVLNKNEKYVVTGYRDPYTWEKKPERNEVKRIVYRADAENTVFNEILNNDKGYYFCNNLQKESTSSKYRNQNPNWQTSYNSVLAVPIRFRHQGNPLATILYGVLCVDSMNHHKYDLFDENIAFNMLAASADVLALMFGHLDVLQLTTQILKGTTSL